MYSFKEFHKKTEIVLFLDFADESVFLTYIEFKWNTLTFNTPPIKDTQHTRAAIVYLNFRAGPTFPVLVCTVSPVHSLNKAGTQWD